MKDNIKKISIIGGSGTGKTTLANNLGKVLNIQVYHLDGVNYSKDWEQVDKKERDKKILEKTAEAEWIMDGTYNSTLLQRLEKSDFIIYLDYSSISQLKGVLGRYLKGHGKEKKEIAGCKERLSLKFLIWVVCWRKNKRQKVLEVIEKVEKEKVIIFTNRKELNKWFKNEFDKELEIYDS